VIATDNLPQDAPPVLIATDNLPQDAPPVLIAPDNMPAARDWLSDDGIWNFPTRGGQNDGLTDLFEFEFDPPN
jgi:hypothetical protein